LPASGLARYPRAHQLASEKDVDPGARHHAEAGHLLFGHGLPRASVMQDDLSWSGINGVPGSASR
jgi:hypothetical protein